MNLQSAIHFLYPPQCLICGVETSVDFALCGKCWREAPFISGLVCGSCGIPLPGDIQAEEVLCDYCIAAPRPWQNGRAALMYGGTARRMVLALKHGDRHELVKPMARWMAQAGKGLVTQETLIVPVPLHARRLFSRRFNQSALLAAHIAEVLGLAHCPDMLRRRINTAMQEGMTRQERFENQKSAFSIQPKHQPRLAGRPVLLIDDVMTSGATLAGCAEACRCAGAAEVNVLVLARVARDT
ncbi:MAG: ComF family protein, partial [Alphaproteobacteria bacterium]|nr:ComF family protein [Alphaproteobacteria bacterium]